MTSDGIAPLGSLIPWPDDSHYPKLPPDEALELFLDWAAQAGFELWPHQEEALLALAAGDHVILGTPTGSGKSIAALGMCFMACCTNRRSYYTAPIKALVSEKFFDFCELLGKENVGMITGDTVINGDAPIICCTEEILAYDALRHGAELDLGCVAMDEFHFFADRDRGWAWQVPLLTLPHVQFLLMSATLGNTSSIRALLSEKTGRPISDIADAPRPVPLSYEFVDTPLEASVEHLLEAGDAPLYIVHFSQDAAIKSATALMNYGVSTKEQRNALKEALRGVSFNTSFGKTLKRLILGGVGVHHAGMLPRYRLTVEKLAQQGLLPVICGTDTLGVGINVPIHTVLLTGLAKFDGVRQRRLNAREFHQIAGRAGRSGFDDEGLVVVEATEYEIERARALAKAAGDEKKARKIKTARPPEGFVGWNRDSFTKLVEASPEALRPRMKMSHAMVLAEVMQQGDAYARIHALVDESLQSAAEKEKLHSRANEIIATLLDGGVIEHEGDAWQPSIDIPEDFALDQPLAPFLLAALELLDPDDPAYALDLISMVEATLEQPYQILRAQERAARDAVMQKMKAEGLSYEERLEKIAEVSYPQPLAELLEDAFERYCAEVPWARDFEPLPKSVLREILETASDFKSYVQRTGIARSEGLLLRYLSDAYRVLARTVPAEKLNEQLEEIIGWLGLIVRGTDSSLIDEWLGETRDNIDLPDTSQSTRAVVHDRQALTLLVRNGMFLRVKLAALGDTATLGALDEEWGWKEPRWKQALASYFEVHDEILLDGDARSWSYLSIDQNDEQTRHVWQLRQSFLDEEGDADFAIVAELDLDTTQELGELRFTNYDVGFYEDWAELR